MHVLLVGVSKRCIRKSEGEEEEGGGGGRGEAK